MAVVQTRTAPRCKICTHPRRDDIDALLELRSRGAEDGDGRRINQEYVLAAMERMGVENPTPDNIKNHWGSAEKPKHSYPVMDGEAAIAAQATEALTADQLAVVERVLGADVIAGRRTATPEELLELQRALFPFELIQKIREGKPLGITWDQLDRGLNTATRRAGEEKAAELVGTLADAIGESAKAVAESARTVRNAGAVDGEAVEDAEVVPAGELPSGE